MATGTKSGGKKKKTIRKAPGSLKAEDPAPPQQSEQDETGRNEYGGLPDRDLKKNLGCG